jgi:DNA-binding NarL/FixJ family response regulator
LGHQLGIAVATNFLGEVARMRGDLDEALANLREGTCLALQIGPPGYYVMYFFANIVIVIAEKGESENAVRLAAAHDEARMKMGSRIETRLVPAYERAIARARTALGDEAFAHAWEAGRAMTFEEAVAKALDDQSRATQPMPTCLETPVTSMLTPRELDVLRLIAEGYPDKRIAAELLISHRTATSHVTSILTKLGVQSRSAAVALAVRSRWL